MLTTGRYFFQAYPFPPESLVLPSILIFISGYLILKHVTKNTSLILVVSALKSLFFFIYFAFVFNGQFTSGFDDYYYLQSGQNILKAFQDLSLFSTSFFDVVGGFHFSYPLLSSISQAVLGEYYYSLCATNVILTFFCGLLASRIIIIVSNSRQYASSIGFSLVLYPDLFLNSSIFAGKDTLVLLLHLSLLLIIANYFKTDRFSFISAIFILLVLFVTRFYVCLIFILFLLVIQKRYLYILFSSFLLYFVFFSLGVASNVQVLTLQGLSYVSPDSYNPVNIILNTFKFILTPRPFFEDTIHKFLLPANIFNWIASPLLLLGFIKCLFSSNAFYRFLSYYFSAFCLVYSFIDFLNGPRHRIQLSFALVIFIYQGFKSLLHISNRLGYQQQELS